MNKAAWSVVLVLFIILVFIVGVRWGQSVEKINKRIVAMLSTAPTMPFPSEKPLEFNSYLHRGCAVSFIYPNNLKAQKETSNSAQLVRKSELVLDFNCVASPSAVPKDLVFIRKIHTQTRKNIYFMVDKSFLPLLESSLKFSDLE